MREIRRTENKKILRRFCADIMVNANLTSCTSACARIGRKRSSSKLLRPLKQ